MKKCSYIVLSILFLCSADVHADKVPWGPKIKLEFTNQDDEDVQPLYFGVDTNATDGYDQNTFYFDGIELAEELGRGLPPMSPPGGGIYAVMLRDTAGRGERSYVDFKQIPDIDKFSITYTIETEWGYGTTIPRIYWGKLPAGIDSAQIYARQWIIYPEVDMKAVEGISAKYMQTDKIYYITVWYNKAAEHGAIKQNEEQAGKLEIYPNPSNDYVIFDNEKLYQYKIMDMQGKAVLSGNFDMGKKIDINKLEYGVYIIQAFDVHGTMYVDKMIKN